MFDQASSLFNPQQKKKEWYEEIEDEVCSVCPALSFQHRIIGCCACLILGFMLSLGSTARLISLLKGDPIPFAILYSLGNVISICSTCFFYGPWSQAKKMFASTRWLTTSIYLVFLCITLFLAFYPHNIPGRSFFIVSSIILQFMALCWYTLSFIPYGREMAQGCLSSTFPLCCPRPTPTIFPTSSSSSSKSSSATSSISSSMYSLISSSPPSPPPPPPSTFSFPSFTSGMNKQQVPSPSPSSQPHSPSTVSSSLKSTLSSFSSLTTSNSSSSSSSPSSTHTRTPPSPSLFSPMTIGAPSGGNKGGEGGRAGGWWNL